MQERKSGRVKARPIAGIDATHLQSAIRSEIVAVSTIYTDEARVYQGIPEYGRETVRHLAGEYVRHMAHTNGIESFWALLERGYVGTLHHFSEKHMARYIDEFSTRHNRREWDTIAHIDQSIRNFEGALGYRNLIS